MGTEDMDVTAERGEELSPGRIVTKTVAQLAEEEFVARKHYEHLGASNVAGLSYEEQKKSAIAYAEAKARAWAARAELDAAIRDPSRLNTIAESGDNKGE